MNLLFLFFPFFCLSSFFFSELVDAARKALISRVEELTNDRLAVKLELTSSQETASHLESRMKEMEQETKRCTTFRFPIKMLLFNNILSWKYYTSLDVLIYKFIISLIMMFIICLS